MTSKLQTQERISVAEWMAEQVAGNSGGYNDPTEWDTQAEQLACAAEAHFEISCSPEWTWELALAAIHGQAARDTAELLWADYSDELGDVNVTSLARAILETEVGQEIWGGSGITAIVDVISEMASGMYSNKGAAW